MFKFFKNIGPGTLVAAAFIGPGTVTVCTLTGVGFGYTLLWAMVLSIIATVILQEMAARIGIITRLGLADVIKAQIRHKYLKIPAIILVLSAVVIGNAAYEAGNLSGASLGMTGVFGAGFTPFYPLLIGAMAFMLLFIENYKVLERCMIGLVLVMSLSFILAAVLTKPDIGAVLRGAFIPGFSEGSILTVIGLVGTTVVPYNLFLHASLVGERWKSPDDLKAARKDTLVSVILGGLVSMAIIITAAGSGLTDVSNVMDMAKGLEPLYGRFAVYFIGTGLFAAGITSSVTAPLAAAYVANGCFGWNASLKDTRFRVVWMAVIGVGVLFASLGFNPIELILFAQVANGILLPVIALFLWWVVNKAGVLGRYKNTVLQNVISGVIILITILLGIRSIFKVFGW
ncbi:Nramp family divalent metal transporter [Sinomicrobium weinanense]|uniref:Nramp family divalent metal transporter n=1 Tax=Sinomicrobium weinanense TaxID=2842200 RepID=A0A926JSE7_9FLAO|nr:Nramp family divalent metal transporter [Sinomicrobium weinanense]MBC9796341.1 Nramp family divalent metal transporter [Sinomicrobium weinanense]MBU3122457.1 Nramp family divalent metal transporter [Sinomicrobium weinanense]